MRAQVSLEFLLIFGLLTILLLYSVRNTSFSEGSPSVENLRMQIAIEEKSLASTISNTISQVYAQGPGSKATAYVKLTYLRNPSYLENALNVNDPRVFITYGSYSGESNGTHVTVINGSGTTKLFLEGENKNVFWTRALYQKDLTSNSSVWNGAHASVDLGSGATTVYGIPISPSDMPSTLKVVVEWNPDEGDSWSYDTTTKELRININPGG
jgi:uncharacterized protein (UPF0333 family)